MESEIEKMKNLDDFEHNSRVCIYGAGDYGKAVFTQISQQRSDIEVFRFIDTYKSGKLFDIDIIGPDEINKIGSKFDIIIIASDFYRHDIINLLDQRGVSNYCSVLVQQEQPLNERYFYDESPLSTFINHDFLDEPRFVDAVKISRESHFASRGYHQGRWNLHIILWAATNAIRLDGDIVMLGVFEGAQAAAIREYTDFDNKKNHMFLVDTFTGNPEWLWTEDEILNGANCAQWAYKEAGDIYQQVQSRFEEAENVQVIRGIVPEILPSVPVSRIGLLYLDMNAAEPEKAAAEYFWDKMVPGGMIISDDYGHSREGHDFYCQKLAFDNFAASVGREILNLPTGHGVIIK